MVVHMKAGDTVLVESLAGPRVRVLLQEQILESQGGGWSGQIIHKEDVTKLIAAGVPYDKTDKPVVFIFDSDVVEVINESR